MKTWKCDCSFDNPEQLPTDKRYLKCAKCGRKYFVRGTHVDGSPMLALVGGPSPTPSRVIRVSDETKARLLKIQQREGFSSIDEALLFAMLAAEGLQSRKAETPLQ